MCCYCWCCWDQCDVDLHPFVSNHWFSASRNPYNVNGFLVLVIYSHHKLKQWAIDSRSLSPSPAPCSLRATWHIRLHTLHVAHKASTHIFANCPCHSLWLSLHPHDLLHPACVLSASTVPLPCCLWSVSLPLPSGVPAGATLQSLSCPFLSMCPMNIHFLHVM